MLEWMSYSAEMSIDDDGDYIVYRTSGSIQLVKGWIIRSLAATSDSKQHLQYVARINLPSGADPLREDINRTRGGLSREQRHMDDPRTIKRS